MSVTSHINRRYFFLGCFAAAATACRRSQTALPKFQQQHVSIVRAATYSAELVDIFKRILIEHQVPVYGKRIVLKPNLIEFRVQAPVNTNPVFVASAASAFQSLGAADVRIAEGPGHRRMTLDLASEAGYFDTVHGFESRFTDLNLDDVTRVSLIRPFSTLRELYLPNTVLGCDLLVSLPKMKTHHWTGATLSMKNLFGVVPGGVYGWPKNVLHWAGINECVADLHSLFPKQFCLVDGIDGMEGNGPILGTAKKAGVIVGGSHPPSVDATCCQIMKIDPDKIGYLQLASRASGWTSQDVRQVGERVASVASPFELIPEFSGLRLTT
jgi:uncharacterized protein (DUF362 family)